MLEVGDLVFEYPGKRALDSVSFSIQEHSITALVGPNGAGKTTLIRCLAALARPLSGSVRLGDLDVLEQPRECHRRVGYMSDFFGLYDDLTARQCLAYVALAHGMDGGRLQAAVEATAQRLDIGHSLDKRAGALSRGQRQRLAIAQAIIHEPDVLLLDEPASGLDPGARMGLAELFVSLRAQGVTLVVSSHILAELDQYSTHLMIIRQGRVVEHRALAAEVQTRRTLRVLLAQPVEGLEERLQQTEGVERVKAGSSEASFEFSADPRAQHELLRRWISEGLPICAFREEKTNLQEAYLAKLGELEPHGEGAA